MAGPDRPARQALRVGVDATALVAGNTGVARYAAMHLAGLEAHPDVVALPFAIGRGPDPGVDLRRVRVPLRVVQRGWRHLGAPRAERLVGPLDLVHSIDIVPPPSRAPVVITIHDVLPLTEPSHYAPRQRMMATAQLRGAHRAELVVTTCEATAAQIAEHLGIDRDRLLVAPLGHRPPSATVPDAPVDGPFVLAVGSLTPRKGFLVLLDALDRLGARAPALVLVGPDGFQAELVRERAARLRAGGGVRLLGRLDDHQLEGLYRRAQLLCHPSVAEGFGIPVLEALGYGTPVVAADIPPVREVAGDAALLVRPGDAGELAAAIEHLLRDEGARAAMSARGLARAAPMTWAAMTARIVAGYHAVADRVAA